MAARTLRRVKLSQVNGIYGRNGTGEGGGGVSERTYSCTPPRGINTLHNAFENGKIKTAPSVVYRGRG